MDWPILLRGVIFGSRDVATARIRDAFSDAGAWITDVHFFSGVSTALAFDVARADLPRLGAALVAAGVVLDPASRSALERAARATSGQTGEVEAETTGFLNVTFADGDPDLRHEIPAVPG